jgi:hypothetical protein
LIEEISDQGNEGYKLSIELLLGNLRHRPSPPKPPGGREVIGTIQACGVDPVRANQYKKS